MANSFTNVIKWMELAKISYKQMSNVVTDLCKALGNIDIQDIELALTQITRKQEMEERDAQIAQLIREKAELQTQLTKKEADLKVEKARFKGAHRLIGLLEEHVSNTGEVVTKAQLYDETVAKTNSVTALKLIHICVDYSTRMETIFAEMRTFFSAQNHFFRGSPIPLERVPDLTKFLDLPPMEVLQNLQMPTTLRTNIESTKSGGRQDPGSNARSKDVGKIQPEEVPTPTSDVTPPLPTEPAPSVPSPLVPSPGQINPLPGLNLPLPPDLQEATR